MEERIGGALLIAGMANGLMVHQSWHISRIAEAWEKQKGWEKCAWAMVYEQEVRDSAIRLVATWRYNVDGHQWERIEPGPNGETIRYRFERNSERTSTDWYTIDEKLIAQ